uniref:Uncharacterized protein n=1 Tax=Aegilops tauschii subsp. strangulata TaxID=200361 RepID=A0A453D2R4_AEGTS
PTWAPGALVSRATLPPQAGSHPHTTSLPRLYNARQGPCRNNHGSHGAHGELSTVRRSTEQAVASVVTGWRQWRGGRTAHWS